MSFVPTWFRLHRHETGRTVAMIATVLAMFVVHSIEIWLWALIYMTLGAFQNVESAASTRHGPLRVGEHFDPARRSANGDLPSDDDGSLD